MNSKDIMNQLYKMSDKDIMILISSYIRYLIDFREADFKKIIKELKKCNSFIEKMKRGGI